MTQPWRQVRGSGNVGEMVQAQVAENPVIPREEALLQVEARHGPIGPDEGLLRKVQRVRVVAHQSQGREVCPFHIHAYHDAERLCVSTPAPLQSRPFFHFRRPFQVGVCQLHSSSRHE